MLLPLNVSPWCYKVLVGNTQNYQTLVIFVTCRVSNDVTLSVNTARQHGIEKCVEKMLNFSDQLRRLKVDHYEYVSMKVIVLLTSGKNILVTSRN